MKNLNCIINLAALLEYERKSGKHFYEVSEPEDYLLLSYCVFRESNPEIPASYDEYKGMLENKRFSIEFFQRFERACNELDFGGKKKQEETEDNDSNDITIEGIVDILVVRVGMDMEYVLHRMPLYLIGGICDTYFNLEIEKMQTDRLSHFFQVLPLMAFAKNNKIREPQDLYPLPGEKSKQQRKEEELKKMSASLKNLFKKSDDSTASKEKED